MKIKLLSPGELQQKFPHIITKETKYYQGIPRRIYERLSKKKLKAVKVYICQGHTSYLILDPIDETPFIIPEGMVKKLYINKLRIRNTIKVDTFTVKPILKNRKGEKNEKRT